MDLAPSHLGNISREPIHRRKPEGLPTRKEINVNNDLDGRDACEHFFGKNLEEAEALFRALAEYYQGDLMWMGPVAFRYYVQAFIRYLRSDASSNESDAVNGFAGTLEFRLEYEPKELVPVASELAAACDYILQHWDRFDITPIYGDLRGRFSALQEAFTRLAENSE